MTKIDAYAQLVALQGIWNNAPTDQRHLIKPFIIEEIRHIKALRRITIVERLMKLTIVFICLTTAFAFYKIFP